LSRTKGAGRPSLQKKDPKRKVPVSASLEQGLLWKLEELGITPTELLSAAAQSVETDETKKLELRVEKSFKKWKDLEVQAGIAKAEYEGAKSELESRRKMELDLKLEEDCAAWYLRSQIEDGTIRKVEYHEPSLERIRGIAEHLSETYDMPIDLSSERPRIERNENGTIPITYSRFLRNKGLRIDREGYIVSNPDAFKPRIEPQSLTHLKIDIDLKEFTDAFLAGELSSDTPISVFKEFNPKILSTELKSEIKKRMASHYQSVEVGR